jgi:hypothetical protein
MLVSVFGCSALSTLFLPSKCSSMSSPPPHTRLLTLASVEGCSAQHLLRCGNDQYLHESLRGLQAMKQSTQYTGQAEGVHRASRGSTQGKPREYTGHGEGVRKLIPPWLPPMAATSYPLPTSITVSVRRCTSGMVRREPRIYYVV